MLARTPALAWGKAAPGGEQGGRGGNHRRGRRVPPGMLPGPSRPYRLSHLSHLLPVLAALLLAAACGSATTTTTGAGTDGGPSGPGVPGGAACPPEDAAGSAAIDWVDFVRLDGRMYSWLGPGTGSTVEAERVGRVVSRVGCQIGGVVGNPDFQVRDGDAAFLPEGTGLHRVEGARPGLRLAVEVEGAWRVYEVLDVEDARTGADLLDLGGGVTSIELLDGETASRVLATVDDPEVVRRVVDAVLAAPTFASPPDDLGQPEFLRFHLADGTIVQRPWERSAGVLAQRLDAPAALTRAFAAAG